MYNNDKRVSIEHKSLDAAILRKKSSDDSINSQKYNHSLSPSNKTSSTTKKNKILLYKDDSNDSDFEYY
jgi:hypothetical protein